MGESLPDELVINGVRYVRAGRAASVGQSFSPTRPKTGIVEVKRGKATVIKGVPFGVAP